MYQPPKPDELLSLSQLPRVDRVVVDTDGQTWSLVARSNPIEKYGLCLSLELENGSGGLCGDPAELENVTLGVVSPDPASEDRYLVGISQGDAASFAMTTESGRVVNLTASKSLELPGLSFFAAHESEPILGIRVLDAAGDEIAHGSDRTLLATHYGPSSGEDLEED